MALQAIDCLTGQADSDTTASMAQQAPHLALELLEERYPADQAERIFVDKVKRKPLYLRPTETTEGDAREKRQRERARKAALRKQNQKPKPLSAKEKRLLNIHDVPRESQKYSIYEPLHRMWIGYIQEMLGDNCMPVKPATAARFCSADFHGAEVEIVRARCVSRVGLRGIVVKDTKFTFEIVTPTDQLKGQILMA